MTTSIRPVTLLAGIFLSMIGLSSASAQNPNVQEKYHPKKLVRLENDEKDTTKIIESEYNALKYPFSQIIASGYGGNPISRKSRISYTVLVGQSDSLSVTATENFDTLTQQYALIEIDSMRFDKLGNQIYYSLYSMSQGNLKFIDFEKNEQVFYPGGKLHTSTNITKNGTAAEVINYKKEYILDALGNYSYLLLSNYDGGQGKFVLKSRNDNIQFFNDNYGTPIYSETSQLQPDSTFKLSYRVKSAYNSSGLQTYLSSETYSAGAWQVVSTQSYDYDSKNNLTNSDYKSYSLGQLANEYVNTFTYNLDGEGRPIRMKSAYANNGSSFNPNYVEYYTYDIGSSIAPQIGILINLQAYPNPSKGSFTIDVKGYNVRSYEVRDVQGILIHKSTATDENLINIDISNQPAGFYITQLYTFNDHPIASLKLVKN